MDTLSWSECVQVGAAAGVDPTVVRRLAKGGRVLRASLRVITEAAERLGLASRLPATNGTRAAVDLGISPAPVTAAA